MEGNKQKNEKDSQKKENEYPNYNSTFGDHIVNKRSIIPTFEWPRPDDNSDN